ANKGFDLIWLETEGTSDGVGEHGAGTIADVLSRSASNQSAVPNCEFDLTARLPEVGPIASRYADATPIPAVFSPARVPRSPDLEIACPVVKPSALNVAIPSST